MRPRSPGGRPGGGVPAPRPAALQPPRPLRGAPRISSQSRHEICAVLKLKPQVVQTFSDPRPRRSRLPAATSEFGEGAEAGGGGRARPGDRTSRERGSPRCPGRPQAPAPVGDGSTQPGTPARPGSGEVCRGPGSPRHSASVGDSVPVTRKGARPRPRPPSLTHLPCAGRRARGPAGRGREARAGSGRGRGEAGEAGEKAAAEPKSAEAAATAAEAAEAAVAASGASAGALRAARARPSAPLTNLAPGAAAGPAPA